ncbi:MAG: hypothetical protein K2H30_04720 [Clostridia bacterium]|nr:hypothetical protein [Clostridia bacterium]
MKDFKSYTPENNENNEPPKSEEMNNTVELAKKVSQAMNGKSQGQLLGTIIAEAEKGKRNGTLTNADLDNFYNTLAPLVDGFKRKKLKEVINRLKSI